MSKLLITKLCILSVLLVSCKDDEDKGVSVDKYNDVVNKHNTIVKKHNNLLTENFKASARNTTLSIEHAELMAANKKVLAKHEKLVEENKELIDDTWQASQSYSDYLTATMKMNDALETFAYAVDVFVKSEKATKLAAYDIIEEHFKNGNTEILNAQKVLIDQFVALLKVAPKLYSNENYFANLRNTKARGLSLSGILAEHQVLWDIVIELYKQAGGEPKKEIKLSATEIQIGSANSGKGAGIATNKRGQAVVYTPQEFRQVALRSGFSAKVVDDSQTMARQMNGVAGMATTREELVPALNNLVSHLKTRANTNSDDLEIGLIIDYSGSMSNNIEAVLTQLKDFVDSLQNVINAGRKVRIGIVTFGQPGRERINLDLTTNFTAVQSNLSDLLKGFRLNKHSTDPGEASYYGLDESTKMSWKSKNRQVIVITDEESYSLQNGNKSYVNKVIRKMDSINVYPLMVKLRY